MAKKRSILITDKQVLKKIKIKDLRGIKNLDEISFEGCPVTGIFGKNGSGKTTIIQAVLCLYRAKNPAENTKMSRFFKYISSTDKWIGSSYSATMDYEQLSGKQRKELWNKEVLYKKISSEWAPRQISKPDRFVIYIPLSESIPDIEKIPERRVAFTPIEGELIDEQITKAASQIMGVEYKELKVNRIKKLDCFTVKRNGVLCHSLNLGAGEQKIFRILQRLYRAPQYSLIVIDEIDLTLHTAALRQLIHIMILEARKDERHLQVIFTSHRQELMRNAEFNVRFLINSSSKTFCLDNPTEDCYEQLSGCSEKYLKVYVEDEIAEEIVGKCMRKCGMYKHYEVCKFGSITNSIRLALGLACQFEDLSQMDDIVFFCDGDVDEYTEEQKIKEQIKKKLSGCETFIQDKRDKVLSIIKHFCPPLEADRKLRPEEFIHKVILGLEPKSSSYPELVEDSNKIGQVVDHHEYVTLLCEKGYAIRDIVELIATTPEWDDYVTDVISWINNRKVAHRVEEYN